jgi:hypothetical protein
MPVELLEVEHTQGSHRHHSVPGGRACRERAESSRGVGRAGPGVGWAGRPPGGISSLFLVIKQSMINRIPY